jgi:hypothetical protein
VPLMDPKQSFPTRCFRSGICSRAKPDHPLTMPSPRPSSTPTIEGHPKNRPLRLALEQHHVLSREVRILGVYPGHQFLQVVTAPSDD